MGRCTGIARTLICATLAFAYVNVSTATTITSGPQYVSLVEAYTSEGCSSCPPAGDWLTGLRGQPGLWTSFVPVSFHVDFWDHLGWKDTLANALFGDRLHAYVRQWKERAAATPSIVINGSHDHHWRSRIQPAIDTAHSSSNAGILRVELEGARLAHITYSSADTNQPLAAHVALLGFGIKHRIDRGENKGRVLIHDFSVIAYNEGVLNQTSPGVWSGEVEMPDAPAETMEKRGIAVWISGTNQLESLQSAGGYIK